MRYVGINVKNKVGGYRLVSTGSGQEQLTVLNTGRQKNNSNRDEVHEKNSRIHLDRSQNKYTNCKGIKNNTNSG